jgi:hypothetical protein
MRKKWRRGVEEDNITSIEIEIHNQVHPYVLLENYIFTDGEKDHKNERKWE